MKIRVTVANTTKEAFDMAMRLVALDKLTYPEIAGKFQFTKEKQFRCNGYKIINNELFLSIHSDKCTLFPYKYDIQQTIDFAWGWWQNNQTPTAQEPDTDGSVRVAWEITTENCGIGSDDWEMFVSVKPVWFVYGK